MNHTKKGENYGVDASYANPFNYIYNYNDIIPLKRDTFICGSQNTHELHIPFPLFQKHINELFSKIEGVRFGWDSDACVWNIEFGTRPMEHTRDNKDFNRVIAGKNVAREAADVAATKYPEPIEEEGNWEFGNHGVYNENYIRWAYIQLRIYRDDDKDCLFIHLNRYSGDRNTHWFIWKKFNDYFTENKIWLSRCSYIELADGIKIDRNDHVSKYVLDCMVVRAICEFIPNE